MRQPVKLARLVAQLRSIVRARRARALVANGAHSRVVGGLTALAAGLRSVFLANMIHAHPLWKNDPLDALALASPCDLMLAISPASERTMRKLSPRVETQLFHCGTPLRSVSAEERETARAELEVGAGEQLVGVFGRL